MKGQGKEENSSSKLQITRHCVTQLILAVRCACLQNGCLFIYMHKDNSCLLVCMYKHNVCRYKQNYWLIWLFTWINKTVVFVRPTKFMDWTGVGWEGQRTNTQRHTGHQWQRKMRGFEGEGGKLYVDSERCSHSFLLSILFQGEAAHLSPLLVIWIRETLPAECLAWQAGSPPGVDACVEDHHRHVPQSGETTFVTTSF